MKNKPNNKKRYVTTVVCGCVMRIPVELKAELEGRDKERIRKDWEKNQLD